MTPTNSEVERIAVSQCGLHLATLEACWAPVPRVTLKFWHFQLGSQQFALNTQVDSPHEGAVSLLAFQPARREGGGVALLSCGQDSRAKVWHGSAAAWDCKLCIGRTHGVCFIPTNFTRVILLSQLGQNVLQAVLWIRNELFRIRIQLRLFRVPDPEADPDPTHI